MSEKESMFVFIVGLLMTLGGVGSIEQSVDNMALASGCLVSAVGLMVMYCGTLGMQVLGEQQ